MGFETHSYIPVKNVGWVRSEYKQLEELIAQKLDDVEISAIMKRSVAGIYAKRRKLKAIAGGQLTDYRKSVEKLELQRDGNYAGGNKCKPWTEEEIEQLERLLADKVPYKKIVDILHRPIGGLKKKKHELNAKRKGVLTDYERERLATAQRRAERRATKGKKYMAGTAERQLTDYSDAMGVTGAGNLKVRQKPITMPETMASNDKGAWQQAVEKLGCRAKYGANGWMLDGVPITVQKLIQVSGVDFVDRW